MTPSTRRYRPLARPLTLSELRDSLRDQPTRERETTTMRLALHPYLHPEKTEPGETTR